MSKRRWSLVSGQRSGVGGRGLGARSGLLALALAGSLAGWSCADDARPGEGEGEGEGGGGSEFDCTLKACDVFFTEVLANPKGEDGLGEYVELFNPGDKELDLRGCTLVLTGGDKPKTHTIDSNDPVAIPARGFLLLGPEKAVGVTYHWTGFVSQLPNSASSGPQLLQLKSGEKVIDGFTYLAADEMLNALGAPVDGASFQLDTAGDSFSCQGNDLAASWCKGEETSGDNRGTPGSMNAACPVPPAPCALEACGVFFTELLPNPAGSDDEKEYLELHNPFGQDLDLRGCTLELQVGEATPKSHLVNAAEPVIVPAEGFLLLGPPESEEATYHWAGLGSLPNSSTKGAITFRLVSNKDGGAFAVDEVTYLATDGSALGAPTEGQSFQLGQDAGGDGTPFFACESNDDPAHWCAGKRPAGESLGTPGRMNDFCGKITCVPQDELGNDLTERDAVLPGKGDVIFTEVFANPQCTNEKDYEWIELYNVGGADVDLINLGLYIQATDAAPRFSFFDQALHCFTLRAGERIVLLSNPDPQANGGLTSRFSYAGKISLRNTDGYLDLRLPDRTSVIDAATWEESESGRSVELAPTEDCTSAEGNDRPGCWAASPRPQGEVCGVQTYHTAGQESELPGACYCLQDGDWIEVPRTFGPGEVVISEVLGDVPGSESDNWAQEWVELDVLASGYLNCGELDVGTARHVFPWQECWPVQAGEQVVLAASDDPASNGGLPADRLRELGKLDLKGEGGDLFLLVGESVIDELLDYPSAPEGHAVAQDAAGELCQSDVGYGTSGQLFGTPGAPNGEQCPPPAEGEGEGEGEGAPAGSCLDGQSGEPRAAVDPAPCQVIVSEILANPAGADGTAEWIELTVIEGGPIDLNGLRLKVNDGAPRPLQADHCVTASAGDRLLLVQTLDPALNGGIANGDLLFSGTLTNASLRLQLLGSDGVTLIDAVTLATDAGSGLTHALKESTATCLLNDEAANWCANAPSPGAINPDCPAPGEGEGEGEPVPEGNCLPADGSPARPVASPPVGAVLFSEFFANPAGPEATREWLELYVAQEGPFDLNGLRLQLQANAPATVQAEQCVTVRRGDHVLVAKTNDVSLNDGLPTAPLLFTGTLVNSAIQLRLFAPDGATVIDAASYNPGSIEGRSVQLSTTKLDAALNDLAGNWCAAAAAGTPGAANVECAP